MRASLKKSLTDSPVQGFDRYPKGSVVLCNTCALPIFKLNHGIALGDKSGSTAKAFKPLSVADLDALGQRPDIDAGVRAMVATWTPADRAAHVLKLREVRSGDPMVCPCCGNTFVQVLSVEKDETLDRAYVIELLTIPPDAKAAPVRGKSISHTKDWVH